MIFPALAQWDAQAWLDQVESMGIEVMPADGGYAGAVIMARRPGMGISTCLLKGIFRGITDEQMQEIRKLVE